MQESGNGSVNTSPTKPSTNNTNQTELCDIKYETIFKLLQTFEKKAFEAGACEDGTTEAIITKRCEELLKLDFSVFELENLNGLLSTRYPSRIFIPEYEHGHMSTRRTNIAESTNNFPSTHRPTASSLSLSNHNCYTSNISFGNDGGGGSNGACSSNCGIDVADNVASGNGNGSANLHSYVTFANTPQQQQQQQQQKTIYEEDYELSKIRDQIIMAKYARCRQRFVVPVILFRGKYICRSATISGLPETYGRRVVNYAYDCINGTNYSDLAPAEEENNEPADDSLVNQMNEQSQFGYKEVIRSDVQLLNTLRITTIVDLMVEKRKIKYFMAVSSSEKADPENHYEHFNILSLPYPGCEFFKKFRDNNYMAKNLRYDWAASFNDAVLNVPKLGPASDLEISWSDYMHWDLVEITQNYLKAILKYIQEESTGLLIHCISGWDRTPLFVSMVRLSLWADGHIHQSLNPMQMVYFTLAYDWYLFGHQLPDRLKRGEDIMFFCFHVLKYIIDDEFSVTDHRKRTKTSCSSGSSVIVIKSDCCDDEHLKEDYLMNLDQDSNDSSLKYSNCDMPITDNFYASTTPNTSTSTPGSLTSRSPNSKRTKTSPISVPGTSANRQRHESTSSNGSWQVVTETGSLDSLMNGSYMMRFVMDRDNSSVQSGIAASLANCSGASNSSHGSNKSGENSGGSNGTNGGAVGCDSATASGLNSNELDNRPPSVMGAASATAAPAGAAATNDNANTASMSSSASGTRPLATLRKQRLSAVRTIFIQAYGKTIGLKFQEGSSMTISTLIGNLAEQLF